MKAGDRIKGFKIEDVRMVPSQGITAYQMVYENNGAKLIYLDRDDDNKTFMVGFKTIPEDDTGVFHILEHSLLNGSEHYPVREPFVELLKSSLQTFLNAFTARDMTMYPASSRNHKDFLNLVDVYLDAVFHPLCVKDPFTFRQEGWRYELDDEGRLTFNGVVFNEMKGAMAGVESLEDLAMDRQLFPDNYYSKQSGGLPESITDLTYEQYCNSYHKYYHPGNAFFFLDGKMDIEEVISHIDKVLCEFGMGEPIPESPLQSPVAPPEAVIEYEISPEEEGLDRTMLSMGWVVGKYDEPKKYLAITAILKALSDNNEAPLRKALLDKGLAEDVEASLSDMGLQRYLGIYARNTSGKNNEEVYGTIEDVFREQAAGMDHDRLSAILNKMEFKNREKDSSWLPRGVSDAMNVMGSWVYGGDPLQNLDIDGLFDELRRDLKENYFENLIKDCILNNDHKARVCAVPSLTLGEEIRKRERKKLDDIWESWSEEEKKELKEYQEEFRERQQREDSVEALATLPKLELSDIPKEVAMIPEELIPIDGRTLLYHDIDTGGITYADFYFDISDFNRSELQKIGFMTRLMGQVPTAKRELADLRNEIEGKLGAFSFYSSLYGNIRDLRNAKPYAVMSVAVLDDKKREALPIIEEVLRESDFGDREFIYNILHQNYLAYKQDIAMSGNTYAGRRAQSYCSPLGVIGEALNGISMMEWLKDADEHYDDKGAELYNEFTELIEKIFSKERLTASLTGARDREWVEEIMNLFSDEPMGAPADYSPAEVINEGFQIPAEVGFAARVFNLNAMGEKYSGAAPFASQFISYDYLWNQIRVQGGAYGTGLSVNPYGHVGAGTYRDPQTGRSLNVFNGIGDALIDLGKSGEPIDKYIISTIGELDPLLNPKSKGLRAAAFYLSGRDAETEQRTRDELLNLNSRDLMDFGEVLKKGFQAGVIAVVGGENQLEACKDKLDRITVI